ncbi:MAG TPA: triose-phosphate isomerase [Patescibacteria group bacterium]
MNFRKIIIGNWKMYLSLKESLRLAKDLKKIKLKKGVEVVVCPSLSALTEVKKVLPKKIKLGAQNVFWEKKGAYTGEVSAGLLKELGCHYVIVGHSERRQYLEETDEMINQKVLAVLENKLVPIVCVGENLAQRRKKQTEKVILNQLEKNLKNVKIQNADKLIIAYEPIWAIGTGQACRPEEAVRIHNLIRQRWPGTKIIYGGSLDGGNIASYSVQPEIDGALVGGASARAKEFIKLLNNVI